MNQRIRAWVVRGGGWASSVDNPADGTILRQRPLIAKYFPEIEGCHNGTINLHLEIPLQIRLPGIVTPPLQWQPGGDERFGITEIKLELGGKHYRAWIYTAENSPHRFNNNIAEILTEWIEGVVLGLECAIHISRFRALLVI